MEKGRRMQYLVMMAVSLAGMTLGMITAWNTPVIPKFHNHEAGINLTENEISWVAAIGSLGYGTGSLQTRFISDTFGRRTTILTSALPMIAGSIVILNATSVWMIYLPKLLWGFTCGMIGTVSAVYLAEISDKEIRGHISVTNRVVMNLGVFLVMCVGPFVSFQALSYVLLVLPICYFIACCFVPETPYYLLKQGKVDAARKSLRKLTGSQDGKVLEDKLLAMESDVRKEMLRSSSVKELFTGKQYRKALIIVMGLKVTQVMSGPLAIQQYLGRIAQESNVNMEVSTVLIVFGAIKFIVTIFSSALVDRIGRRPLMLYSYFFSGISLGIVALYFLIQPTSVFLNYIPFIGIMLFTVLSTLGYNTIVYVMVAELFPINVKSVALTFVNIFGGVLNFVSVKEYQQVKDIAGYAGVFGFYASLAIIGAVFTYFMVPETKGKSLGEIQKELQGLMYNDNEAREKLNEEVVENNVNIEHVDGR